MEKDRLILLLKLIILGLKNNNVAEQTGLCREITQLWVKNLCNATEKRELDNFIMANKPTADNQYSFFFHSLYWEDKMYWWKSIKSYDGRYYRHARQIRIDYLTELINNIK